MKIYDDLLDPRVAQDLLAGKIGVLRTDTLYGLVCLARDQSAVERIYRLKDRTSTKSPILLVSNAAQLFDALTSTQQVILSQLWPGRRSVILPSSLAPIWIERDNNSVAYRLPDSISHRKLLDITGAIIAPSANPEGEAPARNVDEAISYFGDDVDFYVDGGEVEDPTPSELIRLYENGNLERLR